MLKVYSGSMEDYLETIALLNRDRPAVRVSEVSRALGVTMPSVTSAIKKLSEEGLVEHEKYGYVRLTPEGQKIAEDVFNRHEILRHFFTNILGVNPAIADEDACKMEHAISPDTLERLSKFVDFVSTCPVGEPDWLRGFEHFFEHGERSEMCLARCHSDK
jgi:DtxR family Mn-dependent transcriptional regulator